MALTKLFDETELSEVRKKAEGDGQLTRLLNFYLLNDEDGVANFSRALNNALHILADQIDTLSVKFNTLTKDEVDKLLEMGVEGGKIAKALQDLRKKKNPAGRPASDSTDDDEKEEPAEELETGSVLDKRASKITQDRIG